MNNVVILLIAIGLIVVNSCRKDYCDEIKKCCEQCESNNLDSDTSEIFIDFVYSVGYPENSNYANVCASSTSNNIPINSYYTWNFNGGYYTHLNGYDLFQGCSSYYYDGDFSISLIITTPDGITYSKGYSFQISGLK